jgi:hypothetical protein
VRFELERDVSWRWRIGCTSEDTDDLDGTGGLTCQVAMGGTGGSTLTITNTDEDDDDAGVLSISVKNVHNDN